MWFHFRSKRWILIKNFHLIEIEKWDKCETENDDEIQFPTFASSILPQSMQMNRYWNRCSCSLMCLHSMICCRQIYRWIFVRHQLVLLLTVTMIRYVCVRANMQQDLGHSFFRLIPFWCVYLWVKCARICLFRFFICLPSDDGVRNRPILRFPLLFVRTHNRCNVLKTRFCYLFHSKVFNCTRYTRRCCLKRRKRRRKVNNRKQNATRACPFTFRKLYFLDSFDINRKYL